ncbi:putative bifunctional diguanylate cyclase/phosphodiesterase [Marinomonas ostreistagni]|uniref:EAL domain-containing protein n=1 Tax=Marinomonas ostreistagni TaxID=359209 RepID=A0ABS0ZBZ2_9GAMM|nr:EAL domain-containing protein [Marinomonas ostreistagni]MBJ7551188.1 EAL domain-containing protein [Marinomonas ostreistagni]
MEATRKTTQVCKVLSVEDDVDYQAALLLSLQTLNYGDFKVEFLCANSAQEAASVMAKHPDISLVLLDVVMEDEDSGLRLVRSIRNTVGNQMVRIILLTGQPGLMPQDELMSSYDIDDYWNKSELSHEHLQTIVLGNLRTWHHLYAMQQARLGLQMMIESSQRISSKLDLKSYTQSILDELARVFKLEKGGIVCIAHQQDELPDQALVFAAAGQFRPWSNQYLGRVSPEAELVRVFEQSIQAKCHVLETPFTALYFSSVEIDKRDYVVIVKYEEPLSEFDMDLLQIFGENINAGFTNVALHSRLSELAYQDSTTGLHNKNWLLKQLDSLSKAERKDAKLVMLFVEELSYSEVLLGVQFGRSLMMHLAAHLKACFVKAIDIVLYERDTLMLLVYDSQDYQRQDLEHVLHPQLDIEGVLHTIDLTGTIVKLSDLPTHQSSAQILGITKSFLEQTKHRNVDFGVFNAQEMNDMQERYELMKKMRSAIEEEEIFIHLQPKVALTDGALKGFEVLVRWQDSEGKMIPPDRFVPLAESSGLIDKLDEYVTRQACQAIKYLRQSGVDVPLSVNVAGSEVSRIDFANRFAELLQKSGVSMQDIEIEVTETQLIEVFRNAAGCLDKLSQGGVRVSIDDFGAGYSSLSYLSQLMASELKIDRQFVWRMDRSKQDHQIVQMIIDLGHLLNMKVIAEGIETQAQYQALLDMGCDAGQGYLIGRPMPLTDVLSWLEHHHRTHS